MRKTLDWQPHEVEYLECYYERCGPKACAKKLRRSYMSVVRKGQRLNLHYNGGSTSVRYINLMSLIYDLGLDPTTLIRRASREGVSRHTGPPAGKRLGSRTVVPVDWAEAIREEYGRRETVERLGWYSTTTVARVFGLGINNLKKLLYCGTDERSRIVQGIPRRLGKLRRLWWNPLAVEKAARAVSDLSKTSPR